VSDGATVVAGLPIPSTSPVFLAVVVVIFCTGAALISTRFA